VSKQYLANTSFATRWEDPRSDVLGGRIVSPVHRQCGEGAPARRGSPRSRRVDLVPAVKRALDLTVAGTALVVAAPLIPVIALAIYLDSPGPVLFRQRRAGRLRRVTTTGGAKQVELDEFEMRKFRTMRLGAESATGPVLASEDDPRVTRVGRVLRKTRLDELPQLWDVLRGAMSLVGPRPERPELFRDLACAIPLFEERMRNVKPGITGLAQVSLGYLGTIPEGSEIAALAASLQNPFGLEEAAGSVADDMRVKLLYDLAYVAAMERLSTYLAMELAILLRTPWVMLRGLSSRGLGR
jgi:lipopolysaccharide/colanic/teichoic acid biosynthesis glycosyltransferase